MCSSDLFANGRRIFYRLVVTPNLEPARAALHDLNQNIVVELGADGTSVILRGEVASENMARQARILAEQLVPRSSTNPAEPMRIVNLLHYGEAVGTAEDRLAAAMAATLSLPSAALAQSREQRQMMADLRMLQEQTQELAIALASLTQALRHGVQLFVGVENLFDQVYDVGRTPIRTIEIGRAHV